MTTRLLGLLLGAVFSVLLWIASTPVAIAQTGCTSVACVSAGPRLASVDTTQSVLLDTLLQALLPGTSIQVGVVDWNGLAAADINLNALITQLDLDLSLSDPSQVLDTSITLGQFQAAAVTVLQADGQTAAANALQILPINIPGLAGTFKLGDLLKLDLPPGSLANIDLDLLDLITGSVQLYNFKNVATTPQPIAVDTAVLGLNGLSNLELWLQVVEPPVYVCGGVGSQFYSGAVRLKLNLDVLSSNFDLQPVLNAISALSLGIANITLNQDILHLQLYGDIARAQGTITAIDALAGAVTVSAQPGIVNLYVGEIADSVFFNRTSTLSGANVTYADLTSLNLGFNINLFGLGLVDVQAPLAVTVRAVAEGSPLSQPVTVNGPTWPQTRSVNSGTVSIGSLVTSLLNTLDLEVQAGTVTATLVGVSITVPSQVVTLLDTIVNTVEATLQLAANALLQPIFELVLGTLVDPLLRLLGIQIGQMVFSVDGIAQSCAAVLTLEKALAPTTAPGVFNLSIAQAGTALVTASNVGHGGKTNAVVTTPGLIYTMAETAGTGTNLAVYQSQWSCVNQDNDPVADGVGANFEFTAPPRATEPLTITCRITNRLLQSDVTISKSDGAATYTPGGSATYVLAVTNQGPDAVTGAQINDQLPNGVTLSGPWTCVASNGTCSAASGGAVGGQDISLSVDLDADGTATISVPVTFDINPSTYQ